MEKNSSMATKSPTHFENFSFSFSISFSQALDKQQQQQLIFIRKDVGLGFR
jgi:hypothetical protein